MSFQIVTEPIDRWPAENARQRKSVPFRASYADTVDLLTRELDMLGAKGRAVVQVVTRNGGQDLRRDGLLRAQAKIDHPGVRLSFTCRQGELTFATDVFEQHYSWQIPGWQANLRAIALSLEALRKVDRYGITKSGEQYRGWQQLEAGPAKLTEEQALGVLRQYAPPTKADESVAQLYRWAKAGSHPDRHGGLRGPWDDVERAAKTLELT